MPSKFCHSPSGRSIRMKVSGAIWLLLIAVGLGFAPAPASAATVLTGCATINTAGEYVLDDDITVAGGCFEIAADNVSLDFQGHTITGNGSDNGIEATGVRSG